MGNAEYNEREFEREKDELIGRIVDLKGALRREVDESDEFEAKLHRAETTRDEYALDLERHAARGIEVAETVAALKAQLASAEAKAREYLQANIELARVDQANLQNARDRDKRHLNCRNGEEQLLAQLKAESAALAQATAERDAAREALAEMDSAKRYAISRCDRAESDLAAARAEIEILTVNRDSWRKASQEHNAARANALADLSTARAEVEQAHKVLDTYGIARGALAHSVAYRIGLIDVPAYEARFDAVSAELSSARAALDKINEIRNSIVGAQNFNWSEHAYPLVAALETAGITGKHYPENKANIGTLIERAEKAESALAEMTAEHAAGERAIVVLQKQLVSMTRQRDMHKVMADDLNRKEDVDAAVKRVRAILVLKKEHGDLTARLADARLVLGALVLHEHPFGVIASNRVIDISVNPAAIAAFRRLEASGRAGEGR